MKDDAFVKTLDSLDATRVALINDSRALPGDDPLNEGVFNETE